MGCRIGEPSLFPESWENLGSRHLGIFHRQEHGFCGFVSMELAWFRRRMRQNSLFSWGSPLHCNPQRWGCWLCDSQTVWLTGLGGEDTESYVAELKGQMSHCGCSIFVLWFSSPLCLAEPCSASGSHRAVACFSRMVSGGCCTARHASLVALSLWKDLEWLGLASLRKCCSSSEFTVLCFFCHCLTAPDGRELLQLTTVCET